MAYNRVNFVDEILGKPVQYDIKDSDGGIIAAGASVDMVSPVTSAGTPLNAETLNKLDVGIKDVDNGLITANGKIDVLTAGATTQAGQIGTLNTKTNALDGRVTTLENTATGRPPFANTVIASAVNYAGNLIYSTKPAWADHLMPATFTYSQWRDLQAIINTGGSIMMVGAFTPYGNAAPLTLANAPNGTVLDFTMGRIEQVSAIHMRTILGTNSMKRTNNLDTGYGFITPNSSAFSGSIGLRRIDNEVICRIYGTVIVSGDPTINSAVIPAGYQPPASIRVPIPVLKVGISWETHVWQVDPNGWIIARAQTADANKECMVEARWLID